MADDQDLAVRLEGEGVPVLVIHGWEMAGFVEAHDFEPVFTKNPGYHRLYVDLPGMGKSPANKVKDLDSIVTTVSSFIEKHILPSNFLLIGSSCGAYLAQALAYKYASAVDGLLLRVPLVEPENEKRDIDPFVPAIANEAALATLSEAEREQFGDIPVQTADHIAKVRNSFANLYLPAVAASDSAALAEIRDDPNRYKLRAPMHSPAETFDKPALILTGRQDTVTGYRDAWPLVKCYTRATFVVMDRADHGLPVDQKDLFQALVGNWLWRVEETRAQSSLSS